MQVHNAHLGLSSLVGHAVCLPKSSRGLFEVKVTGSLGGPRSPQRNNQQQHSGRIDGNHRANRSAKQAELSDRKIAHDPTGSRISAHHPGFVQAAPATAPKESRCSRAEYAELQVKLSG